MTPEHGEGAAAGCELRSDNGAEASAAQAVDAEQLRDALRRPLVLASASPRRADLLRQVAVDFEVRVSDVAEEAARQGACPAEVAAEHARQKSLAVAASVPGRVVLGADTVVVLGEHLLGKPRSNAQAQQMLQMLSGEAHQVITAVALAIGHTEAPRLIVEDRVLTRVVFRELADEEIEAYVATGEPMDKAGAYGIQGHGALLVREIEGCYYNVVGLPLSRTWELLNRLGYCGCMNRIRH
jgi:septum formation protein